MYATLSGEGGGGGGGREGEGRNGDAIVVRAVGLLTDRLSSPFHPRTPLALPNHQPPPHTPPPMGPVSNLYLTCVAPRGAIQGGSGDRGETTR